MEISGFTGKSPLFEIRHVVADANDPPETTTILEKLYIEKSDFTTKKGIFTKEESDVEDIDHSPSWSKKFSSVGLVKKKISPMRIYTYKVHFLGLLVLNVFHLGIIKSEEDIL